MLSKVMPIVLMTMLCGAMITEAAVNRNILGGWREVDVTNSEVQEVAAKATVHLEKARNSAMVYRLQEVVSAKVQVGHVAFFLVLSGLANLKNRR